MCEGEAAMRLRKRNEVSVSACTASTSMLHTDSKLNTTSATYLDDGNVFPSKDLAWDADSCARCWVSSFCSRNDSFFSRWSKCTRCTASWLEVGCLPCSVRRALWTPLSFSCKRCTARTRVSLQSAMVVEVVWPCKCERERYKLLFKRITLVVLGPVVLQKGPGFLFPPTPIQVWFFSPVPLHMNCS